VALSWDATVYSGKQLEVGDRIFEKRFLTFFPKIILRSGTYLTY